MASKPRTRCHRSGRVGRSAEKGFWSTRRGWSKLRPFPQGVEEFGDELWFDVTLQKPFGMRLSDGPNGPGAGCGVSEIAEGGSVARRLQEVLQEGSEPAMWVQEGDELQTVSGEPIDGSQDKALELISAAGQTVTMTFSRKKKGPIKVVFPNGRHVTAPRTALLKPLAEKAGYDAGCTCKNGRCGKCWHEDPVTGEVYIFPLNVPGIVPSVFRRGEDGLAGVESDFESWVPLRLRPAPDAFKAAMREQDRA